MKGRKFLQLAGRAVIACPMPALSQQSASLPLVVVLGPSAEQTATARTTSLREGFKQAALSKARTTSWRSARTRTFRCNSTKPRLRRSKAIIHAFVQEDALLDLTARDQGLERHPRHQP
jgi:hypothetical protein